MRGGAAMIAARVLAPEGVSCAESSMEDGADFGPGPHRSTVVSFLCRIKYCVTVSI